MSGSLEGSERSKVGLVGVEVEACCEVLKRARFVFLGLWGLGDKLIGDRGEGSGTRGELGSLQGDNACPGVLLKEGSLLGLVGVEVRDITIFLLGGDRIGLSGVEVRLPGPEGGEIPSLGLSILLGPDACSLRGCG